MTRHDEWLGRIVGGVIVQALDDARAQSLIVLEADTPEGRLLTSWAERVIGADRVHRPPSSPERWATRTDGIDVAAARREVERMMARLEGRRSRSLVAHPANKTALLLGPDFPPEALLPMGDLYASRIDALAGGWSAHEDVRSLAERAGGVRALDDALRRRIERREPAESAFDSLPRDLCEDIIERLDAGRFHRRMAGIVPKLGHRTLGIDLLG